MLRKVVVPVAAVIVFVPGALGVSIWFTWKLNRRNGGLFHFFGGV